ncbi:MAG TPA: MFS transporter [Verrucomicrobiae bacterium]|jgi:OPA family sugar phosphate sensor protein UhpC-like MFS transporter|nr:MFS transporter [Verrucomicrobiae bacterium]
MPAIRQRKAIATNKPGRDPRYERWRWQIFAITWLAYAGFNLTRKSFAIAKIALGGPEVGLTQKQMAWIDGSFLVAYAIGQFAWGIAADRWGTRRVVLSAMFCSVVIGFVMGSAHAASAFAILFFLQGLCQASAWAPLLKNVGNFFSVRERGTMIGLWCTNYTIGGLLATVYVGYAAQWYGWRCGFFIPAATLFGIWILFFIFQRDDPAVVGLPTIETYHAEAPAVVEDASETRGVFWQVLSNPMILLLGVTYFCFKPTRYAILFWGPKYVDDRLHGGMASSGNLSALFELAGAFSVLAGGYVSDRFCGSRRAPVSVVCLALLGLTLLAMNILPDIRWVLGGALFLLGFLVHAPDALISGIAPIDFGSSKAASTSSGVVTGLGAFGAVFGGVLPGVIQERWGWHGVFIILAAASFVAALLLLPKWNALPKRASQ